MSNRETSLLAYLEKRARNEKRSVTDNTWSFANLPWAMDKKLELTLAVTKSTTRPQSQWT
jgi:hypothetical protein